VIDHQFCLSKLSKLHYNLAYIRTEKKWDLFLRHNIENTHQCAMDQELYTELIAGSRRKLLLCSKVRMQRALGVRCVCTHQIQHFSA